MKKIKIAFLIPTLTIGGGEKLTVDLSEALAKYFDVSILLLKDNIKFNMSDNIELKVFSSKNKLKQLFALNTFVRSSGFDVIISVMEQANFINALLSKVCKTYIPVFSVHTPLSKAFLYRSKPKRIVSNFIYKRLLGKNAQILTVSDGIKNDLQKNFSFTNVKRIYNPIDLNAVSRLVNESIEMVKTEGVTFVNVGRLVSIKGHRDLILAFKAFNLLYPKSRLLIIGGGELYSDLSTLITDQNLADSVYLLGEISNPLPYFLISDLYICSSKLEGFGLTILEAMSTGLIVGSLDCDYGPREILKAADKSYGFLSEKIVNGMSDEAQELLFKVMCDGINDKQSREFFIKSMKGRVQDFSLAVIVEEYIAYISNLRVSISED